MDWPEPPGEATWIWARIEVRPELDTPGNVIATAGPEAWVAGEELGLQLSDVPVGTDRRLILEARASGSPTDRVTHYGISEPFTMVTGRSAVVEVPMSLLAPQTAVEGTSVELLFAGEAGVLSVDEDDARAATVRTRSRGAAKIVVANDPSFSASSQAFDVDALPCGLDEDPGGAWQICTIEAWDLVAGLPEGVPDGLYSAFVKFRDAQGYDSEVHTAAVAVDTNPPGVVQASLSALSAARGAEVVLTVTPHETAEAATLAATPGTGLEVVGPEEVAGTATLLWRVGVTDEAVEGTHTFSVSLEDEAGNEASDMPLLGGSGEPLELAVDTSPPMLTGVEGLEAVGPIGWSAGEVVQFTFVVEELLPPPMEPGCAAGCPIVRLAGVPIGSVVREEGLDEAASGGQGFRWSWAIEPEAWGPVALDAEASVVWSDDAGNPMTAVLEPTVRLDFVRPEALECQLPPEHVGLEDTIVYKVSASEPLGAAPALPEGLAGTPEPAAPGAFVYTWALASQEQQPGLHALGIELIDLAGNVGEGVACSGSVLVDHAPPILLEASAVDLLLGPGESLDVTLSVAEDEGLPPDGVALILHSATPTPVPLTSMEEMPGGHWQIEASLEASPGVEGVGALEVRLTDLAGNEAVVEDALEAPLVVDLSAPLAGCFAAPAEAAQGDVIELAVSLSEPIELEPDPVAHLTGSALPWQWIPGASAPEADQPVLVYRAVVGDGAPEGAWQVELGALDPAGNPVDEAALCEASGVIDATPIEVLEGTFLAENEVPQGSKTWIPVEHDGTAYAREGSRLTVSISVDEAPQQPPSLSLGAWDLGVPEGEELEWTWIAIVDAEATAEGAQPLNLELSDAAGNATFLTLGTVFLDFTAPSLSGTPDLSLSPDWAPAHAGLLELHVAAESTVLAVFAVPEPLGAAPTVEAVPAEVLGFSPGDTIVSVLLSAPSQEGTTDVHALVSDLAGNEAEIYLATLHADFTAPAAPTAEVSETVTLRLRPWGTDETSGVASYQVLGAPETTEPHALVRVWTTEDPQDGVLLGEQTVGEDGAFEADLTAATGGPVWVLATDRAGNPSGEVGVMVRDIVWTATMGGESPGTSFPNPHRFEERLRFDGRWETLGSTEVPSGHLVTLGAAPVETTGALDWVARPLPTTSPGPRVHALYAWDGARERLVVFGGFYEVPLGDTWEFDGISWHEIEPSDPDNDGNPPARYAGSMAWDADRGRAVLFGGMDASDVLGDTWEFDGRSWRHMEPQDPEGDGDPLALRDSGLAWHQGSGKTVLFGGRTGTSGNSAHADTWEWNGASWRRRGPVGDEDWPIGRFWHAMAEDPSRGVVVSFGGRKDGGFVSSEHLEWDGEGWKKHKGDKPDNRYGAELAWDPVGERLLLYGGCTDTPFCTGADTSLWVFEDEVWSELTTLGGPGARMQSVVAYHPGQDDFLLYGGDYGTGSPVFGDSWSHDGSAWEEPDLGDPEGDGVPEGWVLQSLAVHPERGNHVLLRQNDPETWAWTGSSWTTVAETPTWPSKTWHASAWNPGLGGIVFAVACPLTSGNLSQTGYPFDPVCKGSAGPPDLWLWDGVFWELLEPGEGSGGPSPRYGMVLAADPLTGGTLLFGGCSGEDKDLCPGDLWRWDGDWTLLSADGEGPAGRQHAGFATDPERGVVVLFGGSIGSSGGGKDTTWEWDGVAWTKVSPADPEGDGDPEGRTAAGMTWDMGRQRVLLYGGEDQHFPATGAKGLWAWDGTSWELLPLADPEGDGEPRISGASSMAPRVEGGGALGAGVVSKGAVQAWDLDPGLGARPAHVMWAAYGATNVGLGRDLLGLGARWVGAGSGFDEGEPTHGLRLRSWQRNAWLEVDLGPTGDAAESTELTWATSDPYRLMTLLDGGDEEIGFAALPLGSNGESGATLSSSYVEVTAHFRLGKAWGWGFDTGSDPEGWSAEGEAPVPAGGTWTLPLDGSLASVHSPALLLPAEDYPHLQLRSRIAGGGEEDLIVQLLWTAEETEESESFGLALPNQETWTTLSIPITIAESWSGTITSLGFELPVVQEGAALELDWFRLTD